MTQRSYFGKENSTLGSVVPLAMFLVILYWPNSTVNVMIMALKLIHLAAEPEHHTRHQRVREGYSKGPGRRQD